MGVQLNFKAEKKLFGSLKRWLMGIGVQEGGGGDTLPLTRKFRPPSLEDFFRDFPPPERKFFSFNSNFFQFEWPKLVQVRPESSLWHTNLFWPSQTNLKGIKLAKIGAGPF